MALGVVGIDHVQITVPRALEAAALRFYREVLALEEIPKPEPNKSRGGGWFRVGAAELHVSPDDVEVSENERSKRHFCLAVADLAHARSRLDAAGVAIIPDHDGMRRFFVRDPAQNRIEISQVAPASG